MSNYREVIKRIRKAARAPIGEENCVGTAMYIAGLVEKDGYLGSHTAYERFLKNLDPIESPEQGCLISWETEEEGKKLIDHVGVVVTANPVRITHRNRFGGFVIRNEHFESLNERWERPWTTVNFYRTFR